MTVRRTLFGLVAALVVAGGLLWNSLLRAQEDDRGLLVSFISRMVSSPDMKISIGAIDGPLSSNSTIRNVEIADRDGVWFRLDRARLVWSRLALLRGRLEVDGLDADRAEVLRRPLADPSAKPAPFDPKALVPDLPVAVDIRGFRIGEIVLGEQVAGVPARLAINGRAKLGEAATGLDAEATVRRLDAPGTISAKLAFEPQSTSLNVALTANEPAGGVVAGLLNIAGRPAVDLDLKGAGPLDDFAGTLSLTAGPDIAARASARLQKAPTGRQFTLDGQGRLAALAPARFAPLVADPMTIAGRGRIGADGVWSFDDLSVVSGAGRIGYAGTAGLDAAKGTLRLQLADIARLTDLVGRPLTGSADLAMDIDARPRAGSLTARLDGRLQNLATDLPAFDRLTGGAVTLSGPVELSDAGFGATDLAIVGQFVTVRAKSTRAGLRPALDVDVALSDVSKLDERITGTARLTAQATGMPSQPNLAGALTIENAMAIGRPVRRLSVDFNATDVLGDPRLALKLDGEVDGRPARGAVQATRTASGWTVPPSDIAIGRATISGSGTIGPAGLATGRVRIAAPALDDLSALALREMRGRLDADVTLSIVNGVQVADVVATGANIRAGDITLGRLDIRGKGSDLLGRPMLDAKAQIENASVADTAIPRLRLVARGTTASTNLDLTGEARGVAITGKATVVPGERLRVDLSSFDARRGGRRLALAAPATIVWSDGVAAFERLTISADAGRLTLSGHAGSRLDLNVEARALPLATLALVTPGFATSGVLDGQARITGSPSAPAGDWSARISRLSDPALQAAGVPTLDVTAKGRLDGGSSSIDARVNAGRAGALDVDGRIPLDASRAMDLRVRGTIDASAVNTMLAANGQSVTGKVNIDLALRGRIAEPQVSGNATLAGGSFTDPLNGIALTDLNARIAGTGRELTIRQLSASTRNGGSVSGSGTIGIAPNAGYPARLRLTGRNAQISSTQTVSSIADFDLSIDGALLRRSTISGRVIFQSMDVTVPERLPLSLRPLPNARHIHPGPFAREMLALERKAKARARARSPFDANLDIAISAPSRLFVRGRGIDAEFGGDLRLTGTVQKPNVIGQFDLRRGRLAILGKRIDISQGRLSFTGGLTPDINFTAETTSNDATLQVGVAGPASEPSFTFGSTPQLPTDEVLSRLLFAKPSGGLSAFQAVMLAQSVAQFTGAGAGIDVFEKLRKSLGVDSFDIREDASGGVSAGASRYISDNVSVGVRAGAKPEQTTLGVTVDITRRVRGVGEVSADGKTSVGIGVEWEY